MIMGGMKGPAFITCHQQTRIATAAGFIDPYSSSSCCYEASSSSSSEDEGLDGGDDDMTVLAGSKRRSARLLEVSETKRRKKQEVMQQLQLQLHSPRSVRQSTLFAAIPLHHKEMRGSMLPPAAAQATIVTSTSNSKDDGIIGHRYLHSLSEMYRSSSCFLMLGEFRKLMQSDALNQDKVLRSMRSHALQIKRFGENEHLKLMLDMQASLLGLKGWEDVLSLEENHGTVKSTVQQPHQYYSGADEKSKAMGKL